MGGGDTDHAAVAANRGSWGVGRFYFAVRARERCFEIYHARAPSTAGGNRKGGWFLYEEFLAD